MTPAPVLAVQTHGGAEGLVSHQIGHVLFACGMVYLLYRLQTMRIKGAGWRPFKTFLWLLLAWNILTFSGHWLDQLENKEKFIRDNAVTTGLLIDNFQDAYFYLTRLDHLLLVPACIFLVLALRKWRDAA